MQEGLSEDQILEIEQYASSSKFSPREKLALTYAERITLSDQDVDEALFAQVRDEFPVPAIVELTATVAFENYRSKFNHALLIESNGFCLVKKSGQ